MRRHNTTLLMRSALCVSIIACLSTAHGAEIKNNQSRGAPTRQGAPFVDGDRVCFVGDSITHYGNYHRIVAAYYLTRYPGMSFRFFNCGIGSERLGDMNARFERDVLSKKPTYIAVMSGMNDSYSNLYDNPDRIGAATTKMYDRFTAELERFTQKVNAYQPRGAAFIASSPYDQTARTARKAKVGKNDLIVRFGAHMGEVSKEAGFHFVDFNAPMLKINLDRQAEAPGFSICGPDRVHPGWPGNTVMGYHFLKSQGVERYVASVSIDHRQKKIEELVRCKVDNLKFTPSSVSYTYRPASLPFPLIDGSHNGTFADGLEIVPFEEDLNKEAIQVTGLEGSYDVYIDDHKVCDNVSAQDLAKGVNLGFNALTPQQKRSQEIWAVLEQAQRKELVMRGAAGLAYRDLPKAGLGRNSPKEDIEKAIAKWIGAAKYKEHWARAYWEIYHFGKAEQRMAEFEAFFKQIEKMNQPDSYRVKVIKR